MVILVLLYHTLQKNTSSFFGDSSYNRSRKPFHRHQIQKPPRYQLASLKTGRFYFFRYHNPLPTAAPENHSARSWRGGSSEAAL